MKTMMAVAAFALATGNAQAYDADYNVKHVGSTVTFTSALDQKSYFVSSEIFDQAQEEGVKLEFYLANRADQGYPPTSLDECRVLVAGDAMKIFGRVAVYVKFYIDVAIETAWNEMERIKAETSVNRLQDAERKLQSVWNHLSASQRRALKAEEIDWITVKDAAVTEDVKVQMINQRIAELETSRLTSAEASVAMNRLQDAKGKPHVTSGVWYDRDADTYNWFGPKFHRLMSEPASEFLDEVGPYLYIVPPSIDQSDTDWAIANAARIEAEKKAKAAAGPTKEELESAAHDAEIRASNERALKSLPPKNGSAQNR